MMKYNFKDIYYDIEGKGITNIYTTRFFSNITSDGDGSREKPFHSKVLYPSYQAPVMIFAGGYNKTNITSESDIDRYINGNGIGTTFIEFNFKQIQGGGTNWYLKDFSLPFSNFTYKGNTRTWCRLYLTICEILKQPSFLEEGSGIITFFLRNCLIRDVITHGKITVQNQNSFVSLYNTNIAEATQSLYEDCSIKLTADDIIGTKANYYIAFDNCRFKIENETEFKALEGTTESELRANFAARCKAQEITPRESDQYGMILSQERWVFTKGSSHQGVVYKDSEIHEYEKIREVSFGYINKRANKISISADEGPANSFTPINSKGNGLVFKKDSISFDKNIDITNKHTFTLDSNIIWLGGKRELSYLNILNNLPSLYGVSIDNIPNLLNEEGDGISENENRIEEGKFYLVRSGNKEYAEISYNGINYNTSLANRNAVFKGVKDIYSFIAINNTQPLVYEITDKLQYKTIQMRIVNTIHPEEIKGGNLLENYWYFVEHTYDQNNTSDFVTYNGKNYYVGSSFCVKAGKTSFTTTGTVHLKRCWNNDFNYETETDGDKAFWKYEQKPKWFDVIPNDLRCLMKANSGVEVEMQSFNGEYIASGHPLFYNKIIGSDNIKIPSYPIKGTYMQLRLIISTLNMM